jgi:excisionase family DNA binding protein
MTTDLLSVEEAAEYLRISRHTLRTWMGNKKVTYVKLGRRTLFRREDLDKLIKDSVIDAEDSPSKDTNQEE